MNINRIKILLVDDDEDDYVIVRELVSEISAWKPELDWAKTYDEALERSRANSMMCISLIIGLVTANIPDWNSCTKQ